MSGQASVPGAVSPSPVVDRPPPPVPPVLVAGLARAGLSALHALRRLVTPDEIWAWDADTGKEMQRTRRRLEAQGIRCWLGSPPGRVQMRRVGTLIKSPGIPMDAPVLQRARDKGVAILDELELGWRLTKAPLVGVTGTNGKSTVAGLLTAVLAASGARPELAGNTDFGPPLSAVSSSADWIVCEVSSFQLEACDQLVPELAVLTNLSREHLGRHRTMERYGLVKRRLFIRPDAFAAHAVIGVDDDFGRRLAADLEQLGSVVSRVGIARDSDYRIEWAGWNLRRAAIAVNTPAGRVLLDTALPGLYNARNVTIALAAADLIGITRAVSLQVIGHYPGVPGRFEHVDVGQPFDVIVDFANTPDALLKFLRAVRVGMSPRGRLTTVLSADMRPGTGVRQMGRIGRRLADRLILTTAALRGVPPVPTLEALLCGARTTSGAEVDVVLDRRRAIERALCDAVSGDVVAITGRGATPQMLYDRRGTPVWFDDREVAADILNRVSGSRGRGEALSNGRAGSAAPVAYRDA